MNYCSTCGSTVSQKIPEGDNRPRFVCNSCNTIHYQNPNIVAGSIPKHGDKILLCKRAIKPRKGYWTLPAGFMENNETISEAAIRETLEEAEANIANINLYTVINVPHVNQVHIFFRGDLVDGKFGAGEESIECKLFTEDEVPWNEIAFKTVSTTLELYFKDRRVSNYPVRVEDITHKNKP